MYYKDAFYRHSLSLVRLDCYRSMLLMTYQIEDQLATLAASTANQKAICKRSSSS